VVNLCLEVIKVAENKQEEEQLPAAANAVVISPPKKLHHFKLKLYEVVPGIAIALMFLAWVVLSGQLLKFNIYGSTYAVNASDSQLKSDISSKINGYKLKVLYPDGSIKSYALADMGLTLNDSASINKLRDEQKSLLSRLTFWKPLDSTLVFSQDQAKLNSFIANDTEITIQPPQDATLTINGGTVSISNEVAGKRYGLSEPVSQLLKTAGTLSQAPVKLKILEYEPAITNAELQPYKAQIEKTVSQPVSFTVAGQTVTPSQSEIASWLDVSADDKTKSVSITVDDGKVQSYIEGVAANYGHAPVAQVDVTNSDGSNQVLISGQNGVSISGENSVANDVAKNLLNDKGVHENVQVNYVPYTTVYGGDYPKWIIVDLTNKVLYAYQGTQLVNSFLVSAGKPSTPTPTGEYYIWDKLVSQTMTGPGYVQPDVPWVNYFDHNGDAIHGVYWRPVSYFGHINSSHGCVGLLENSAEWVYNWAPIGTPVIIHT
jgi:lipoprotein-anchoring transpeptidase ErfK/SrfK